MKDSKPCCVELQLNYLDLNKNKIGG